MNLTIQELTERSLSAVDRIIANLAQSDFPLDHGLSAVKRLESYRLDMAGDVFQSMLGRRWTEDEWKQWLDVVSGIEP